MCEYSRYVFNIDDLLSWKSKMANVTLSAQGDPF